MVGVDVFYNGAGNGNEFFSMGFVGSEYGSGVVSLGSVPRLADTGCGGASRPFDPPQRANRAFLCGRAFVKGAACKDYADALNATPTGCAFTFGIGVEGGYFALSAGTNGTAVGELRLIFSGGASEVMDVATNQEGIYGSG